MKVLAIATISVAAFLAYSVIQYCRESAPLHPDFSEIQRIQGLVGSGTVVRRLSKPVHHQTKRRDP